jgi:hypothetical protein
MPPQGATLPSAKASLGGRGQQSVLGAPGEWGPKPIGPLRSFNG